jgi:hypothetical protein
MWSNKIIIRRLCAPRFDLQQNYYDSWFQTENVLNRSRLYRVSLIKSDENKTLPFY